MASGGTRPGAGRKRKADKYQPQINKAEKRIADRLPQLIDNLMHLADGGYSRVKEKWAPAGTVLVGAGEMQRKAFPKLPDDELVMVERVTEIADKDRAANEYLINRVMGKPTERVEQEVDVKGEVKITDQATKKAASKLDTWRTEMMMQLAQMQAPPGSQTESQSADETSEPSLTPPPS